MILMRGIGLINIFLEDRISGEQDVFWKEAS